MTGPEHYRAAQLLLAEAQSQPGEPSVRSIVTAQVHATLAVAAHPAGGLVFRRAEGDQREYGARGPAPPGSGATMSPAGLPRAKPELLLTGPPPEATQRKPEHNVETRLGHLTKSGGRSCPRSRGE